MSGVERKASQSQEVRLDSPLFHGQDSQGRAFTVGAQGAVRDPNTGKFRLIGPALKLNLGGRKVTELTADGGTYDEQAKTVTIGPNVRISRRRHGLHSDHARGGGEHRYRRGDGFKGRSGFRPYWNHQRIVLCHL